MTDEEQDRRIDDFASQMLNDGASAGYVLGALFSRFIKIGRDLGLTREMLTDRLTRLWDQLDQKLAAESSPNKEEIELRVRDFVGAMALSGADRFCLAANMAGVGAEEILKSGNSKDQWIEVCVAVWDEASRVVKGGN